MGSSSQRRDQGTWNLLQCTRYPCGGWSWGLSLGHSDTAMVSRENALTDLSPLPSLLSTLQWWHTTGEILEAIMTEVHWSASARLSHNSAFSNCRHHPHSHCRASLSSAHHKMPHKEVMPCWSPAAGWEACSFASPHGVAIVLCTLVLWATSWNGIGATASLHVWWLGCIFLSDESPEEWRRVKLKVARGLQAR